MSSVWELRVRTSGSLVRAMVSSQARVSARMVALDDVSFMTALLTADTFLLLGLLHWRQQISQKLHIYATQSQLF